MHIWEDGYLFQTPSFPVISGDAMTLVESFLVVYKANATTFKMLTVPCLYPDIFELATRGSPVSVCGTSIVEAWFEFVERPFKHSECRSWA